MIFVFFLSGHICNVWTWSFLSFLTTKSFCPKSSIFCVVKCFCPCQPAHICHLCKSSLGKMDTAIRKVFAHKNNRESKTNKHQQIQHRAWLYLSPTPPPTVVYFYQAGALFCIENAKFWLFCCEFTHFLVYFSK